MARRPNIPNRIRAIPQKHSVKSTLNTNVEQQLHEGLGFHKTGDLISAKVIYENILKKESNNFHALQLLGTIALQQKNIQEAIDTLSKALLIQANHAPTHNNLGVAYQELKIYEKAISCYEKSIFYKPDYAAAYCNRGNALKEQRNFEAAAESYRQAIRYNPDYAEAFNNLGVVYKELKLPDAALESYNKAINLKSDFAQAYSNKGSLLQELKKYDESISNYQLAVQINPQYYEAFYNWANTLQALKQFEQSIILYDNAIAIKPDYAQAYSNRGLALQALKKYDEAIISFEQSIQLQNDYAEAYCNLANTLKEIGKIKESIDLYNLAISIHPQFAQAYSNRGNALQDLEELEAAVQSYDHAIALRADYAEAFNNRANALRGLKQFEAAITSSDKAISIKPDYPEPYSNRGNALQELNRTEEAIKSYSQAIALNPAYAEAYNNRGLALHNSKQILLAIPDFEKAITLKPDYADAYWNKSLAHLTLGEFDAGWKLYEWRWKNKSLSIYKSIRHFQEPLWLGEQSLVNQTILLYAEQGLGDTLQFCRFVKKVSELGAKVILEVQPPLKNLLLTLEGVTYLHAQGEPLPPFDYQCPLMSLPLALKTTLDNIPHADGYIQSNANKATEWKNKFREIKKPRIGLVWSGNPAHKNDQNRSISLSELIPHLHPSYQYIILQKEVRGEDRETLKKYPKILTFENELKDFSDTAALIECMDLVISVDTSVAHLAGALGKDTRLLIGHAQDWRWLLDRSNSPWYTSMKIYRQIELGKWTSVLQQVNTELDTNSNVHS